jgi:hypothetical protein
MESAVFGWALLTDSLKPYFLLSSSFDWMV